MFYILSLKYSFFPYQEVLEVVGVFALGALVRVITIWNNPNPPIDVYYILTEGFEFLLRGINPYAVTFTAPPSVTFPYGSETILGYPPLMLIMMGFGYFLADVRYSILAADLVVAFLLYRLAEDENLGLLMAALYALNPFSTFVVRNAWNDSVLTAFLLSSILMFKKGKNSLSAVFLGLSLGIKQFAVLFMPYMWRNYTKTQILISIAAGAATYIPFIIWSPYDLVNDLFLFFSYVRYDSKSLLPFLLRFFWSDPTRIPATVRSILSIVQYSVVGYVILRLWNRSTTIEKIAYNFGLTLFIFIILSPISNINYFYLLFPFFALGIKEIATGEEKETTTSLRDFISNLIPKLREK